MKHSESVEALNAEQKIFYNDMVARAKDSIEARSLAKQVMRQLQRREIPHHMSKTAHLVMSRLRAMHDPEHAAVYDRDPLDIEQERFIKLKDTRQQRVFELEQKGQHKDARIEREGIAKMVSPKDRQVEHMENVREQKRLAREINQQRADADFQKMRTSGIETVLRRGRMDHDTAVSVWESESAESARNFCNRQNNVLA